MCTPRWKGATHTAVALPEVLLGLRAQAGGACGVEAGAPLDAAAVAVCAALLRPLLLPLAAVVVLTVGGAAHVARPSPCCVDGAVAVCGEILVAEGVRGRWGEAEGVVHPIVGR